MNLAAHIDRLDDWINPIVVKELRQAVRSRIVIVLVLTFLGLQLFLVGAALMIREARTTFGDADWTAGRDVFMVIQCMLIITLTILVPAYACIRLAGERSDQNVDLLFISTLKPHAIIAGKFFAALMLALLIFAASAPFMTFTYLLRGIDIPTILAVAGIDLLCMLFGTMFAMFLAATPGNRAIKFFTCFVGFLALSIACMFVMAGTLAMIDVGVRGIEQTYFWLWTGIIVAATFFCMGMLFVYAVAMVSPPTANRILPVRLFFFGAWSLATLATYICSHYVSATNYPVVLVLWTLIFGTVLGQLFLIAICERDQMGPRLARSVPKNPLLRFLGFFVYTGSAGGLTFTLSLALLSMGGVFWWLYQNSSTAGTGPGWNAVNSMARVQASLMLYIYCYGISGVLVRICLLSGQVRSSFTWLISMLLAGLGSSIPAVIVYIFFRQQMYAGQEGYWWKLPSPFLSVAEIWPSWGSGARNDEYEEVAFWFLGIWAVTVTALLLPWYIQQLVAFRPRSVQSAAVAERVAEAPSPAPSVNGTPAPPPSDAIVAQPAAPAASVQTTG